MASIGIQVAFLSIYAAFSGAFLFLFLRLIRNHCSSFRTEEHFHKTGKISTRFTFQATLLLLSFFWTALRVAEFGLDVGHWQFQLGDSYFDFFASVIEAIVVSLFFVYKHMYLCKYAQL